MSRTSSDLKITFLSISRKSIGHIFRFCTGRNQFKHYLFEGIFGLLEAKVASSKAALIAAIILQDYKGDLPKLDPGLPHTKYLINNPDFNYLNKRLKSVEKGEALYYWFHALKIPDTGK